MSYILNGDLVYPGRTPETVPRIPVGTYQIGFNDQVGYYLGVSPDFVLPDRLYGDIKEQSNRIITTFKDRPGKPTGVLLSGLKGAGKSLLVKLIALRAMKELSMPVIIVSKPFTGVGFIEFLNGIKQPVVVVFDEFEKVYRENSDQEQMLSLFDGMFNGHRLSLLTINDTSRINSLFINRPGRCYYHFKFNRLDPVFVEDYLHSNLKDKSKLISCQVYLDTIADLNFDVMSAVVEEMNRYSDESPFALSTFLNAAPGSVKKNFELVVRVNGEQLIREYASLNHPLIESKVSFVLDMSKEPFSPEAKQAQKALYDRIRPLISSSWCEYKEKYGTSEYGVIWEDDDDFTVMLQNHTHLTKVSRERFSYKLELSPELVVTVILRQTTPVVTPTHTNYSWDASGAD